LKISHLFKDGAHIIIDYNVLEKIQVSSSKLSIYLEIRAVFMAGFFALLERILLLFIRGTISIKLLPKGSENLSILGSNFRVNGGILLAIL